MRLKERERLFEIIKELLTLVKPKKKKALKKDPRQKELFNE